MNKSKKLIVLALAGTMVVGNVHGSSRELQRREKEKTQEKIQIQRQMDGAKSKINSAQGQVQQVASEMEALDQKISNTSFKISKLQDEIDILHGELLKTQKELEKAKENLAKNEKLFEERLRTMYMNGNVEYLEIIMNSKSIEDLLRNNKIISTIAKADADLIAYIQEQIDTIREAEEKLQRDRAKVENSKVELEVERSHYEEANAEKSRYMANLESNIDLYREEYNEAEANWNQIDGEIRRLQEQIRVQREREEAARRRQQAQRQQEMDRNQRAASTRQAQNIDSGPRAGAQLNWPVPGHSRISSGYGYRMHPILKTSKFHSGVDIPAPAGTPAVAAESGTVIMSTHMKGYGNVVMIDHGNMVTVYAHNSANNVSVGQKVNRGDVVSFIGSTGMSTGPHLHFEVRINGSTVNPMGYI